MHGQSIWCVRCLYIGMCFCSVFVFLLFFPCNFVVVADAVHVFILETHVQHHELKSQMFIIISKRESGQISVCCYCICCFLIPPSPSTTFWSFHLLFCYPYRFLFTSNWWCDIYKMISIFDLIGWLFELLQMDIKSNKFVYWLRFLQLSLSLYLIRLIRNENDRDFALFLLCSRLSCSHDKVKKIKFLKKTNKFWSIDKLLRQYVAFSDDINNDE